MTREYDCNPWPEIVNSAFSLSDNIPIVIWLDVGIGVLGVRIHNAIKPSNQACAFTLTMQ